MRQCATLARFFWGGDSRKSGWLCHPRVDGRDSAVLLIPQCDETRALLDDCEGLAVGCPSENKAAPTSFKRDLRVRFAEACHNVNSAIRTAGGEKDA